MTFSLFCKSSIAIPSAQQKIASRIVLGFVIDSFGVQNVLLYFWGLGSFVLRHAVEVFEEPCKKTISRMNVWTWTLDVRIESVLGSHHPLGCPDGSADAHSQVG